LLKLGKEVDNYGDSEQGYTQKKGLSACGKACNYTNACAC
jgi:hypothetical protein